MVVKFQAKLEFPTGWDSATFRDKGTEVPSLTRDKGTTGQAPNIIEGRDGPGQHVKIGTGRDGTVQDFNSLSRFVLLDKTGQSRNVL